MRDAVGVTVTRKNPKLPKLLKALSRGQIEKALEIPTEKTAVYVAEHKLRGQVLNRVSGNLAQSLLPSVKTKGFVASFGTPLNYGAVHEFGKGHMPKRPWLAPGTKEYVKTGKFMKQFKDLLLKDLTR